MPTFLADTGAVGMTPTEMQGVQGQYSEYTALKLFSKGLWSGAGLPTIANYAWDIVSNNGREMVRDFGTFFDWYTNSQSNGIITFLTAQGYWD